MAAAVLAVTGIAVGAWHRFGGGRSAVSKVYQPRPAGSVTFNQHIAPIVFAQCANCHRPGESGPFHLLTYADAKKRAPQIAEVTQRRFMPPWLPEDGHEALLDARRLTVGQIGLIG